MQAVTDPAASGLEHVVLVTLENRSFDHFLGWLPGADGRQAGLAFPDRTGVLQSTYPLAPDFQGCGRSNPDHSYAGSRLTYANGACDGWLLAGANDSLAIGYYTQHDLAFLGAAAPAWTTCDRYFAPIMAETAPNRIYQHAAQADRLTDSLNLCHLPTIWDRLAAAGVSGHYYFSDLPILGLWGLKYVRICKDVGDFYADCASGHLPAVSYVDPHFVGEQYGITNDDHPPADIRNGEALLARIYQAVTTGPAWSSTLLVITFDEWGGFFDHVPPPPAAIPQADQAAGNQDGLRGFRVPCVLISPWSRRGHVSSTLFDHTSVLRLIEWRWSLEPLTVRDGSANNLAAALDFTQADTSAPIVDVPKGAFGGPCGTNQPGPGHVWRPFVEFIQRLGWP